MNTRPLPERFWEKVNRRGPAECWPWIGATNWLGYGRFRVGSKNKTPSRVSWEMHNGPIPEGLDVLHHCDSPPCVNPAHLFTGTAKDNLRDMVAKGRSVRGRRRARANLNTVEKAWVLECIARGERKVHIAEALGVGLQTVYRVEWLARGVAP